MKGFMRSAISLVRTVSVVLMAGLIPGFVYAHSDPSAVMAGHAAAVVQPSGRDSGQRPEPAIRITDMIDEAHLLTLKGNTHPLARSAYDKGAVSEDLLMGDLVLVLRRDPATQAAFDKFVASQYDPKSAHYHAWLTPEEVGEEFGPAQADVDAISAWLMGHGFAINEVSKDRLAIRFSGTAGQVQSAFHTEIHSLDVKGELHVANMADPQIPAALGPVVVGVKALHNFFPRPLHRVGGQVSLNRSSGNWERVGTSPAIPTKRVGISAPSGVRPQFGTTNADGDVIEDVAPYDFATIYDVLPLWNASTPIDGTGQTIAIAGTSNINLADVASFRSAFGLPVKAPTVTITNSDPGDCPGFNSSCSDDLVENTLDVEWAGAVAKGATIVLVTSSAPTPTSDPLYLSESYIVQNKTAPVMNVSYGECELVLGNAGNINYNNLWQTAASEGIAVFVASGDAGAPACDQGFDAYDGVPYAAQFGEAVNGIASTPYNTAVGGTDFNWGAAAAPYWSASNTSATAASALGYVPEVAWNDTCTNPLALPGLQADAAYVGVNGVIDAESACNFVLESWSIINSDFGVNLAGLVDTIGGGGGASNCINSDGSDPLSCDGGYGKPSWQAGVTGIPNDSARDVPDVSFFASNGFLGSAYLICVSGGGTACTYSSTSEPTAQEVGGTSVASPAMAGVMALINQKSGAAQGNPNTLLYELAAKQTYSSCSAESVKSSSNCLFNDIDSGTNSMACISGSSYCTTIYNGDPMGTLNGYAAGAGYDGATGLGSLNVANVANNWPSVAPLAILSVNNLTFASTTVGYSSATQTVTLKNTGKSALSLNGTGQGITIKGTNAASFSQTNTCGTSVAAGASCTITVTFKPTATGTLTAAVNIADNTFGSPQTVALSGTGVAPAPGATLSAQSLTFSAQWVGASATAPNITLTNSGQAALTLSSIGITGTNASSFSETNTCGTSVAAGTSCTIAITFKPAQSGTLTAALSVADNASGSPQTMSIGGTGNAVVFSPASLAFASTKVGVASSPQTITLSNKSTVALMVTSIGITGTNAAAFSQTNTCGTSVAAGGTCAITVTFKPTATGTQTASIHVSDNAYGSPQAIAVSGAIAAVSVSPTSIGFVISPIGVASAPRVITLTNQSVSALAVSGISLTGSAPGAYSQTNTCGTSVAANASCSISVTFKPTASGFQTASVSIADGAVGSPQTVSLVGAGTAVSLSPASLSFASTAVGASATTQQITLANKGATALSVTGISVTGTNASSFTETNTCGSSVAAAASCVITVGFKPSTSGTLSAAISVADSGYGSPQTVALTGTGFTVSLSPTTLAFPLTSVGTSAATMPITLINDGTATLSITGITITGTNASSFTQTDNCGASLAAKASCTITVSFKPTVSGALTGGVSIADNASGSPQVVALNGSGTTVSVSPASIGFVIAPIGTASAPRVITLTNQGPAAVSISGISLTGTAPAAYSQTNNCGASIAAAGTCSVSVIFKPTASGFQTASVSIADGVAGASQTVSLVGAGTAVSLSPASLVFPLTSIGVAAATQQVTLTNKGTTALSISSIGITGTNASSFTQTNTCGSSVAATASCVVTVAFKPAAPGTLTAAITFTDSGYGSPQTAALSGTGGGSVSLSTASLTYAPTLVGSSAATQQVTVTNKGTAALSLTGITITGADASSFSQTNTCGSSVAASGTCAITVTFKPATSGALTAAVNIADNASGSPQTIALSGDGTTVSVTPASIGYVIAPIGVASAARVITVTNKGTTALTVSGISLTGSAPGAYSQTNTCGTSVAAAGSCTISVIFKPTASGFQTASVSIADGAYGSPQTVTLVGAGTAVSLAPASLTFPSTAIGVASATQQITLTNKGTTALSMTGISITGTNASSYTETNTCGSSVAAAVSCTITVGFKPTATGALTAAVTTADSGYVSPQAVAISGTGH
jgi:Pro-kumamolisin, activation domain/Abnormal spindle-like microcephaly-assoc'd, ASPM-SPD-2-Hydin